MEAVESLQWQHFHCPFSIIFISRTNLFLRKYSLNTPVMSSSPISSAILFSNVLLQLVVLVLGQLTIVQGRSFSHQIDTFFIGFMRKLHRCSRLFKKSESRLYNYKLSKLLCLHASINLLILIHVSNLRPVQGRPRH